MNLLMTLLRGICLTAAWLSASQSHAHQASDAYLSIASDGGGTVSTTLAIALKDLDLALPEADADNNRELTWRELQAVMPLVQRRLGQQVALACKHTEARPAWRDTVWVFDALEQRTDTLYARLRAELPCPVDVAVSIRYTFMKDLDPTHRAIVKTNIQGEVRAMVLAPGDVPVPLHARSTPSTEPVAGTWGWQTFQNFVPEGIHHILTGYDHLAFLLALLLPLRLRQSVPMSGTREQASRQMGLSELLWTVTAFTLGHSVTLVMASLGIGAVPSWVEPTIALSIGFSALLNLYPQPWLRPRWLALGFGLVHGLGFANIMKDADLSNAPLAWALAGFNTGVELGQLACVAVWCVINLALARWKHYDVVITRGGSMVLIGLAMFWTWERMA